VRRSLSALAAVCLVLASGCGSKSNHASAPVAPPTTGPSTTTPTTPAQGNPPSGTVHRSHGVAAQVPRGWSVAKKPVSIKNWPVPLQVISSFRILRASANASCPKNVIASMPPNGVYILVAQYTSPRPRGIPRGLPLGPRGDLSKLDIRPSEVECWEGLSGAKDFKDHGRSYRVEVLFGLHVTRAQRRRAREVLGSLKLPT
jgi:hypothetical protein